MIQRHAAVRARGGATNDHVGEGRARSDLKRHPTERTVTVVQRITHDIVRAIVIIPSI